jgi:hypothetical protein
MKILTRLKMMEIRNAQVLVFKFKNFTTYRVAETLAGATEAMTVFLKEERIFGISFVFEMHWNVGFPENFSRVPFNLKNRTV